MKLPRRRLKRDVVHAGTAAVPGAEAANVELVERDPIGPGGQRAVTLLAEADREVTSGDRVAGLGVGDQQAHAVEGDGDLFAAGEHASHHPWEEAQPTEVRREHGQVADAELARSHRPRRGEQHQAETDVGCALAERPHALVEHAIAHGGLLPGVDQRAEMGDRRFGRIVDLHRRGCGHDVAEKSADRCGCQAIGGPVALDPGIEGSRGHRDADQRDQQHQGGALNRGCPGPDRRAR